ncbi:MAG: aldehyde dehydrogenase family protein, partial [Luteibacter sp.]
MLESSYPYYVANKAYKSRKTFDVIDKYTGKVATRAALPDAIALEKAIVAAHDATLPMKQFAPYQRQAVLEHCVTRFRERKDEL